MNEELSDAGVRAVVIGDLVGSRRAVGRAALHRSLLEVLEAVNARLDPLVPLAVTAGDEFQGSFATVGQALHATTWLRLVHDDVDVRHGVGWGGVEVLTAAPRVEDGPAWWAARAAIEHVSAQAGRPGYASRRTAYRRAEGTPGPDPALVEPLLLCRDLLLGSCPPRSLRLLRGLLEERTQAELAVGEGITPSAVSQRVRQDHLAALVEVETEVRSVR